MAIRLTQLLTAILCFCTVIAANAQHEHNISTLQKALAGHEKDDTIKVDLLTNIAYEYNKISPYDGIRYAMQARVMAEEAALGKRSYACQ